MNFRHLVFALGISALGAVAVAADSPADLNDLEIAHVAYIADNIDIQYAHIALALSTNPDVRDFAKTMIRDHEAVNEQALALLKKLNADPQDNFLSQSLLEGAEKIVDELTALRGPLGRYPNLDVCVLMFYCKYNPFYHAPN